MNKKDLGDRLRRFRKRAGMSQDDVAIYLNLSRSAYTYYETGKSEPSLQSIVTLAKLYNVTTDEILIPKKSKPYMGK